MLACNGAHCPLKRTFSLVFKVADILNDTNDLLPTSSSCLGCQSVLNSKAKGVGKYDKYINHVL